MAQDDPCRSEVAAQLVVSWEMGAERSGSGAHTPPAKRVFPHGGAGDPEDEFAQGIVSEDTPHVTLLYGLLSTSRGCLASMPGLHTS